jgi:hypothetical protein
VQEIWIFLSVKSKKIVTQNQNDECVKKSVAHKAKVPYNVVRFTTLGSTLPLK